MESKNKRTCEKSKCIDCITAQDIKLTKIVPLEIDDEELKEAFLYFLYHAPNIDCIHASSIPDKDKHNDVFHEMTYMMEFLQFSEWNASLNKEVIPLHLGGDMICFSCLRAIYKKKKNSDETELECFLRHIRNAIAHGRFYYIYVNGVYRFMLDDENEIGNKSARIVCDKSCFMTWKTILEKYSKN